MERRDAMSIVPDHVKELVDRLIVEYERAYCDGEVFCTSVTIGDRVYKGQDTTKYYLDVIREFRSSLNAEEGPLFEGDSKQVIKNIYYKIVRFYDQISFKAVCRVKNTVECQKQLMLALGKARNVSYMQPEADFMLDFITDAAFSSWDQSDSYVDKRVFVLVKTEEKFEEYLKSNEILELTPGEYKPFSKIRVAFKELSEMEVYQRKNIYRKYVSFWNKYRKSEQADEYFRMLNFWNDIAKTGIYYVFVPKK